MYELDSRKDSFKMIFITGDYLPQKKNALQKLPIIQLIDWHKLKLSKRSEMIRLSWTSKKTSSDKKRLELKSVHV